MSRAAGRYWFCLSPAKKNRRSVSPMNRTSAATQPAVTACQPAHRPKARRLISDQCSVERQLLRMAPDQVPVVDVLAPRRALRDVQGVLVAPRQRTRVPVRGAGHDRAGVRVGTEPPVDEEVLGVGPDVLVVVPVEV